MWKHLALLSTLPFLTGCLLGPRSGAVAVSQRPFFSSDINTVEEGSAQIEAGVSVDPGDRTDTPVLATYGTSERSQIMLGYSPWVHVDRPGNDGDGPGDLLVGFKHRFFEESETLPGAALQLFTKLPTGSTNEGISSGEIDFFANGIVTQTFDDWSITGNYELGVLGETGDTGTDLQHAFAIAAGRPIGEQLTGFGELLGILQPESNRELAQLGLGVAWAPRASTLLDAGVVFGLDHDAPDFQLVFGITVNFGAPKKER